MKKLLFLTLTLTILLFAGCTKQPADTFVDEAETLGSLLHLDDEASMSVQDGNVVYVFKYQDQYYRVIAPISEELEEEYMNIDFFDDDFNEKQEEIISPLKIEKKENLTEQILSKDEIAKFVGKTGKDLVDEGWDYSYSHNLETMEFWMDYGPFDYTVVFDGSVAESDYDSFDDEEDTKDLVVKSIDFHSLSSRATDLESITHHLDANAS